MIWRLLERFFEFLPRSKFRRWAVLGLRFDSGWDARRLSVASITVRELFPGELSCLNRINPNADIIKFKTRFDLGNRCFVSELEGIPVFYQWVLHNGSSSPLSLKTHTNMNVDLLLPSNWTYRWDTWTSYSHRGKNIQPFSTRTICKSFHSRGSNGFVTLVNVNNYKSLRALSKNGFKHYAVLTHFRCFGRDLVCGKYCPPIGVDGEEI